MVMLCATAASGQDAGAPIPAGPDAAPPPVAAGQQTRPATVAPAAPGAPERGDATRVHAQMVKFEDILRRSVQTGAEQMSIQVRRVVPDSQLMLAGNTEVSGYRLEGYGAFFVVRVPGLVRSYAMLIQVMGNQQLRRRNVSATVTPPGNEPAARPPQAVPYIDSALITEPDAVYTREVKNALIDSMLDNSSALRIAPSESLTVAARDSAEPDPFVPTSQSDFQTLMFTIKGSDLSEYHAGKITIEEARQRVKVTEN
jgi:hypothetical protein